MMQQAIDWWLANAQGEVFGGLAAVSILGYVAYAARALPARLWRLLLRVATVELTVRSTDHETYRAVSRWLSEQRFMGHNRRMKLISQSRDGRREWLLVPAPGIHWLWSKGQPIMLTVEDSSDTKSTGDAAYGLLILETLTLRMLGRGPERVRQLMTEARELEEGEERVKVHTNNDEYWSHSPRERIPRPIASVVTHDGLAEELLADAAHFLGQREWYTKRGIPWRRGYMLSGPPGTGKSSLVFALASELHVPIYALSLGAAKMSDSKLITLLRDLPERAILLIEDIDSFTFTHEREGADPPRPNKKDMTLSGLLNAMDGVASGEGLITILTSNHPDRLDAALTRPGRVDQHRRLTYFGRDEVRRMWRLFHGEDNDWEQAFLDALPTPSIQPAKLQEHLSRYHADSYEALRAIKELS